MDRISIITLALAKKFTKDTVAALEQVVRYIGVTTTAISDGSTTNPITINGQSVTVVAGDTVFYNGTSYAWDGNAWQEVINIAEIITAVEALGEKVHDILGDIAPGFNSASTYAVDDVVLYEDDIYIFTNEHTGAWDSSDVAVTSIAQLVDDLRAEIASTNGRVSALEAHVTQSGDVIDSDNHSLHIVGEAIETEKTVSGNPITVTDALPYPAVALSAEIEASQDLHGYDKPYVGGAYKNKLPMILSDIKAANTGGTWSGNVYTINGVAVTVLTDNADNVIGFNLNGVCTANFNFYVTALEIGLESNGMTYSGLTTGSDETYFLYFDGAGVEVDTGEVTITSGRNPIRMGRIVVRANANLSNLKVYPMVRPSTVTDPTFAPYSNICPISGRTAVSANTYGNNLSSKLAMSTDANGAISASVGKFYTAVEANKSYVLMFNLKTKMNSDAQANRKLSLYLNDNVLLYQWTDVNTIGMQKITITPTASGFLNLWAGNGAFVASTEIIDGIYLVNADHTHTVTIQLGQTVYGGTLNVTTGVLTITHVIKTFVGGENENWDMPSGWQLGVAYLADALTDAVAVSGFATVADIKSNMGEAQTPERMASRNITIYGVGQGSGNNLYVSLGEQNDTVAKFKAFLASNNLQICYPLATPQTIQLTPNDLQMLKGYNRLSCDGGGDITLTYKANKADSVQAEVDVLETTKADNADVVDYIENGNTASRAYSANQFILWKGDLYKVTTSIASGATITAGTNVSKTTIGAVLTALLNA